MTKIAPKSCLAFFVFFLELLTVPTAIDNRFRNALGFKLLGNHYYIKRKASSNK